MAEEAAVPPVHEWKVFHVRIASVDVGHLDVRAPDGETARSAAEAYMGNGEGVDLVSWVDGWYAGYFHVPDGEPAEQEPGVGASITYDSEKEYEEGDGGAVDANGDPKPEFETPNPESDG